MGKPRVKFNFGQEKTPEKMAENYFITDQLRHHYIEKPTALIHARLAQKVTQIETARIIGLTRQRYGDIEKSLVLITEKRAEAIALHFEKSIDELFIKEGSRFRAKPFQKYSQHPKIINEILFEIRPVE